MLPDFSAITQSPRYKEEKKYVEVSGKKKAKTVYLLLLIPILWIPLIIYALSKIPASLRHQKEREAAVKAFAQANNFTYESLGVVRNNVPAKGPQFALPYSASILYSYNTMAGQFHGLPFTYTNTAIELGGNGRVVRPGSDAPPMTLNVFRIQLPASLPRLFADSKFNNMPGFEIRADNFADLEKHTLEGDFPTHYNVRAEKNDRIDVLSVLSPEVMQALKANFHYDLWINGKELQLLASGTEIEYFAAIPLVFKNVEVLLKEVDMIARAMR